jgi:hypothetical protein
MLIILYTRVPLVLYHISRSPFCESGVSKVARWCIQGFTLKQEQLVDRACTASRDEDSPFLQHSSPYAYRTVARTIEHDAALLQSRRRAAPTHPLQRSIGCARAQWCCWWDVRKSWSQYQSEHLLIILHAFRWPPDLVGTWTTKSRSTVTGPGFYNPVADEFIEPDHTGISYSFTPDGHYEEAYYRAIANPTDPSHPSGIIQWQHGSWIMNINGSLSLSPIAVDGRQLTSEPGVYDNSLYIRYNQSEYFQVRRSRQRFRVLWEMDGQC